MAEASQIVFSFQEIAELMIKRHRIHEGIWGLFVKFGIGAANMGMTEAEVRPTAFVPILEMGLQRFDKESNLTVDASKINPKTRKSKRTN
ncbi:MAG: hypothetical protein ABSC21_21195 [Terriglobia bacterium]|jgi:hypothetical protein